MMRSNYKNALAAHGASIECQTGPVQHPTQLDILLIYPKAAIAQLKKFPVYPI